MPNIRFSRRFRADLRTFVAHSASGARARLFEQRIVSRCHLLKSSPLQGRPRPELGARVRSVSVSPFVVVYRLSADGQSLSVLRVIDGRRDFGTISFAPAEAAPTMAFHGNHLGGPLPPLKNDPFFEQLRADIQEAIDECDRGETYSLEEVEQRLNEAIRAAERLQQSL